MKNATSLKSALSISRNWGFSLAFAAFLVIVGTAAYSIIKFQSLSLWTNHTHEVLRSIKQIETLIERAEDNQRSYLLARNPSSLKAYGKSTDELKPYLQKLNFLVADNPIQKRRAADLQYRIYERIGKMDAVLERSKDLSLEGAAKLIDLQANAVLQSMIREIEADEESLLAERRSDSNTTARSSMALICLGALFAITNLIINRRAIIRSSKTQANQALLLNSIFESMSNALLVVDKTGNVTKFNRIAEEYLGSASIGATPEERLRSGGLINIETGLPVQKHESALTRALAGSPVTGFEVLSVREGVPTRVLNVDSRPILSESGEVQGALALFQDITERKNLENEWKRAREAALQASHLKSDFLATMSHEIRTPMNGVIGMTTLLLDTSLNDDQKSFVKTIKSSSDALLTLINQILDHSKIEAGKLELESGDFNLPDLLESVQDMFRYTARSKNVELDVSVDPTLPKSIRGDSTRLRQILINLIGNALKFTDKGFVRVSVSSMLCSDDFHKILFEVKDTGAGIPKDRQANLFEKFSQAHSENFAKYGGTGLGLTIAKELTRLMRGEIGVESAEGFGSRFWFTAEFAYAAKPVHSSVGPASERRMLKGHILVAEDQMVNKAVIERFLKMFGVTCEIASNGQEAFDAFKAKTFDMILMDCQMPVLNGYLSTEKIRAYEKQNGKKAIPIVALTAEGRSGDREKCFAAGMTDFLTKPLDIELLSSVLGLYLEQGFRGEPFDISKLEKLHAIDSEGSTLALVMIRGYLESSPATMDSLRNAWGRKDLLMVSEEAHALRSISLSLGLIEVGTLCDQLEDKPNARSLADLEIAWVNGMRWLQNFAVPRSSQVA